MKFMMIVKATKEAEAGRLPTHAELVAMDQYTEDMRKAGILLESAGLTPSSKGARIRYEGKRRTVIDGPFAEAKELIAGYCIIEAKSREEAIEWAKRVPFQEGELELRQLHELDDFQQGPAVDKAREIGEKLGK